MPLICAYGYNDATGAPAKLGLCYGTGVLDALGEWAIDYTEAGFTAPPAIALHTTVNTTTDTDNVWNGGTRTCTTTAAAGICLRGTVLAALGPTVRQAAAGSTFYWAAVAPIA